VSSGIVIVCSSWWKEI